MPPNPWLSRDDDNEEAAEQAPVVDAPAPPPVPVLLPVAQPGLTLPDADERFPVKSIPVNATVPVWWVGAHGGAGESTLEQLLEGSRAAGHTWPVHPLDAGNAPKPSVVILARTHAAGLRAAQRLTAEWATGEIPVSLLGLVLVADAPGKLPRVLRDFAEVVAGGAPVVWHLPWVDAWRIGEPVGAENAPRPVRRLLDDLHQLVSSAPSATSTPTTRT